MRVRIYQPSKTATQSGRAMLADWLIDPDLTSPRLPDPLMGWASAADTNTELSGKLRFASKEEAITFAVENGWEFEVIEPQVRRVNPRSYLDNFRIVRPQDEERRSGN